MEIRFHLWMSGWSPAGSGDVFGGGSVPVACTRQSHMVATENPTWEAPSVCSTSLTPLPKARAKSSESNYLKKKLPQVLIPVITQMAGFYRDWALTDVMARPGGMTRAPFAKSTPKLLSTLFNLLLGQIMSLPPTPVIAFLLSDPTAHWEQLIVSASPQDFQSTNPQQPSPGDSKSSRALPPKAAQEEEITTGRGSICPTQLRELLDVWPSYPSPLLLLSALFCTWTQNEKPWFQPLAGVILSPRPAQLGNLVSLQPRPGKTATAKGWEVKSASSRRGGGQHVPEQGEGRESSPSPFIQKPCRNVSDFEDNRSKDSSFLLPCLLLFSLHFGDTLSTQRVKCPANEAFFKSSLWAFAMQTNNLWPHCTFSQETKGTPCALYLLFLSFVIL